MGLGFQVQCVRFRHAPALELEVGALGCQLLVRYCRLYLQDVRSRFMCVWAGSELWYETEGFKVCV